MRDLGTDLHEYFDALAARMAPLIVEPTDARSRRAGRRPVWVAAAAVLVVVVLIAGFLVARDSDDPSRGIHTPANVDASQRRWEEGWHRVDDAVPVNAAVLSMTAGNRDGILASGYTWRPSADPRDVTPAIWHVSQNGDFRPAELEPVGAGRVDGVAYWGTRYWASGTLTSGGAVTWFSEDGESWSVISRSGLLDAGASLLADELGLIAYGNAGIGLSSDGVTWTRGDLQGAVNGVVRRGDELVALVGPLSDNSRTNTIWISRDGLAWEQVADLGSQSNPGGRSISEWRGALWAATFPGGAEDRSQLWRSEDARTWTRVAADLPAHTAIDTLTGTVDVPVATGFDVGSRPGGWVSPDGLHWLGMPDSLDRQPGGRLNLAVTYGNQVTALSTSELRDAYAWSVPARATPVKPTEPLATTGWVVIDRVDGDRLTVHFQKAWQSQEPFEVLIGSVSRWATSSGEREPLCPGMAIQAVGTKTPAGEVDAQTVTIGYPAECVP